MRLWSIHPEYLDSKGLVALWREALLAQSVLLGNTKGYKNHPQLIRFKNTKNPVEAIALYLKSVLDEADKRKYNFNRYKIIDNNQQITISVTNGQIEYEFKHLLQKLKSRDVSLYDQLKDVKRIELNPIFRRVCGDIEPWEKIVNLKII